MSATLQQILAIVREANTNSQSAVRQVAAVDNANLIRNLISDGVFDTSTDGSQWGFHITNSGMDLHCSLDGTPTEGNFSEALVYGRYCKINDSYSLPFFTLADGDATYDRIDTVYVVAPDKIAVSQGTPAATPTAAEIPDNALKIAEIRVPAGETDGSGITITDKRVFVGQIVTEGQLDAKADKVVPGADNNIATLDGTTGNLKDSGVQPHTHDNKTVLDAITDAGSGKIITDDERSIVNNVESISSDMTITFTNDPNDSWNDTGETDLAAAIQAKIDALPKFLTNGAVLTLQFSDGTYNLNNAITISGFFGSGEIIIKGNSADAGLTTTKSVILDFTATETSGININTNYLKISVQYLHIKINATTTNKIALGSYYNTAYIWVYSCILENIGGTSYGHLLRQAYAGNMFSQSCYFTGGFAGALCQFSGKMSILEGEDLTTSPKYGVYANGGLIHYNNAAHKINGSSAEIVETGAGRVFT